jgi:hypothetical protein
MRFEFDNVDRGKHDNTWDWGTTCTKDFQYHMKGIIQDDYLLCQDVNLGDVRRLRHAEYEWRSDRELRAQWLPR